jgi:hypothetical protein
MPFSIKVNAMDIYNAKRRHANAKTFLAPELEESIQEWMIRLNEQGWTALYAATPGEEVRKGYIIAFFSPWQKEVINY